MLRHAPRAAAAVKAATGTREHASSVAHERPAGACCCSLRSPWCRGLGIGIRLHGGDLPAALLANHVEFVGERVLDAASVLRLHVASTALPPGAQSRRCIDSRLSAAVGSETRAPPARSAASSPRQTRRGSCAARAARRSPALVRDFAQMRRSSAPGRGRRPDERRIARERRLPSAVRATATVRYSRPGGRSAPRPCRRARRGAGFARLDDFRPFHPLLAARRQLQTGVRFHAGAEERFERATLACGSAAFHVR